MTLLPEYRAQLYGAAERRARSRAVNLPRSWPVVVSTAIAVGVAVVAVAVLSHRHPSSASHSSPPASTSPAVSAKPLTGMLGVLRRPQTEADRQTWVPGFFDTFASPGCRAAGTPFECTLRVDRPLIRQVAVLGTGYRVGLIPYTSRGKIAGVAVTLRGPGINYVAAGPWIDSTTFPPGLSGLRVHGLLLPTYIAPGINRGAIVVPDGVARVVLGPIHLLDTTITRRLTPIAGASSAVFANVALLQLNGLTAQNLELRSSALRRFYSEGSGPSCQPTLAVYRLPAVTHMDWVAPNGRVVKHTLIQFPLYVGVRHPAPGTTIRDPSCSSSG